MSEDHKIIEDESIAVEIKFVHILEQQLKLFQAMGTILNQLQLDDIKMLTQQIDALKSAIDDLKFGNATIKKWLLVEMTKGFKVN